MDKRTLTSDGYSLHYDFPDALCYAPIAEWDTNDVWVYLMNNKPKWDKDHSELFNLYAKASGDECQFITDLTQNSCGGSRFGCWVCTVVNEDKSMQGFIENGDENLKPLNDFRNYIKALREDSTMRADYKRDGRATYKIGGLGPFLSYARIEMLKKLLLAEKEFMQMGGKELISDSQIIAIQEQWDRDFDINKSAIRLAKSFHKLKEVNMAEIKVLHTEILREVANDNFYSDLLEHFIADAIRAYNDVGKTKAKVIIKHQIQKILDDKTAKHKVM